MSNQDLLDLKKRRGIEPWRIRLAEWIESSRIQNFIIGVILFNAVILGLETDRTLMARHGTTLLFLDKLCLVIFCVEIISRLLAYRFAWLCVSSPWCPPCGVSWPPFFTPSRV